MGGVARVCVAGDRRGGRRLCEPRRADAQVPSEEPQLDAVRQPRVASRSARFCVPGGLGMGILSNGCSHHQVLSGMRRAAPRRIRQVLPYLWARIRSAIPEGARMRQSELRITREGALQRLRWRVLRTPCCHGAVVRSECLLLRPVSQRVSEGTHWDGTASPRQYVGRVGRVAPRHRRICCLTSCHIPPRDDSGSRGSVGCALRRLSWVVVP